MGRRGEYSNYTLHVCSHMRLVVYAKPDTLPGELEGAMGWFHVDKTGLLEDFTQACQASIHRFDMEWPDDCTNLNHMLAFRGRAESGNLVVDERPTPSSKAIYQLKETA